MRAPELEPLTAPQPGQDLEALVELLGAHARVGVVTEEPEVPLDGVAESDAEHEAPAREVLQRHRLPRELPRATAGERGDEGAEHQVVGGCRDRGERDPRVDVVVVIGLAEEQVVPEEEAVPSRRLGVAREAGEGPSVTEGAEIGHVESVLHAATLLPAADCQSSPPGLRPMWQYSGSGTFEPHCTSGAVAVTRASSSAEVVMLHPSTVVVPVGRPSASTPWAAKP